MQHDNMAGEASEMLQMDIEPAEPRNYKRYLAVAKWIGAAMLTILVLSMPGIVISLSATSQRPTLDYEVKIDDANRTACVFVKRYDLREGVYLTVCNMNGHIILDIRRFFNETASIRGIPLNLNQWLTLKQMTGTIDTAINEARTYWKELKELNEVKDTSARTRG
ncbi:MAG: hypothetical protein ABW168_10165 [Sedimenticola sp.]